MRRANKPLKMRVADEQLAADRHRYPSNDFVLGALVLGALIAVIAIAYATGFVK